MKEYRVDIFGLESGRQSIYFDTRFEALKYAAEFTNRYVNIRIFLLKKNVTNKYDIVEQIV